MKRSVVLGVVFIIGFLFPDIGHAQEYLKYDFSYEFPVLDKGDLREFAITLDPLNGSLYLLDKTNTLYEVRSTGNLHILDTLSFSYSEEYHYMESRHAGDGLIFWENGLGEVYTYDTDQRELAHISETAVQKLMFFHGAFVDRTGAIYAQSGYGFWEIRDLLLKFEPEKHEWTLESESYYSEDLHDTPHIIWCDFETNEIYYLTRYETARFDLYPYNLGKYDLNKHEWTDITTFYLDDPTHLYFHPFKAMHTYRRDPENQLTHLYNDVFFDERSEKLLRLSGTDYDKLNGFVFFYSEKDQEWIFAGSDQEYSTVNIVVGRVSTDQLEFTHLKTFSPFMLLLRGTYPFLILILLTGIIAVILIYKKEKSQPEAACYTFKLSKDRIAVSHNGDQIPSTDSYMQKTWETLYWMKKHNTEHIPISEFDDKVFLDSHSSSFRSKRRKSIIDEINSYHPTPLLIITTNPLDKRYKDIKVNLDLIRYSES